MADFRGASEVNRQEQRLKSTFALIDGATLNSEQSAHYARYLCVLVAGYAEQSLKLLLVEHSRKKSHASVHRFTEQNVNKMWGINQTKLKEMLDSFDLAWYSQLDSSMAQEISSLHSVGKLRDNISHGNDGGITLDTMKQYRDDVFRLVRKLIQILDPPA